MTPVQKLRQSATHLVGLMEGKDVATYEGYLADYAKCPGNDKPISKSQWDKMVSWVAQRSLTSSDTIPMVLKTTSKRLAVCMEKDSK